ncbi:MAG: WecB/TagA/CpsF family glycosyltransferase [Specibacter sp.]
MNDWQEFGQGTQVIIPETFTFHDPEPVHASAILGGATVDLRWFDEAVIEIMSAAQSHEKNPLAVVSANLDHIMHFGAGSRWAGSLDSTGSVDWLTLLDGAPLRAKATQMTGQQWPRLAGSDLIHPLLDEAESAGLRIGFLGGTEQTHSLLKEQLKRTRPKLKVSGWWAPERDSLVDPAVSEELARDVARAGTDMLVVGLGKPRQELWIAQYGALTGASVLLAFGAVVDFLAGRISRAPQAVANAGMEWAWRLALEPRRLAKRYLVQGPEAMIRMNRYSSVGRTPKPAAGAWALTAGEGELPAMQPDPNPLKGNGDFAPRGALADITVVVVTYNNAEDIDPLLAGLRAETRSQSLKVVIADNGSTDGTVERIGAHQDVVLVCTGGNLGYAGGINAALRAAGHRKDVLVLNPDLRVMPGAVASLRGRLKESGAGIVVPRLLDDDGSTYTSLRREPSLAKALGDAVLGSKLAGRPDWLSEIDYNAESYQYPHQIDWATGAALLISWEVLTRIGEWDERYFLYSEETDYFRRTRHNGFSVWFEPTATMMHSRGGSGASADLVALMAVNRVRYASAHHSRRYAALVRTITATGELARSYKPENRQAFLALAGVRPWKHLPRAVPAPGGRQLPAATSHFPSGAVIIPAHNEAAVIARTLRPLAELAASGAIEVIVACNGCTDATAAISATFPGVRVLDLAEPSKTAALNVADAASSRWPRLYLDADIEITTDAVAQIFEHLAKPGALAARPEFRYETSGVAPLVQAYYRARMRIPAMREHLWGAGAYAFSAAGHARFSQFPTATADDAYVDSLFDRGEKVILPTEPVVVRVPHSTRELHRTLRRIYRGNHELAIGTHHGSALGHLIRSVRSPQALTDAGIYASFAALGKLRKGKSMTNSGGWDRDESSRNG